jgi:hypothetical protein
MPVICRTDEDFRRILIAESSLYAFTALGIALIMGGAQVGFPIPVPVVIGTGVLALGSVVTTGIRSLDCKR